MTQLYRNFTGEMGDLLFKKIDEGINDHQSWPLSDATFRDALEIYCYRSKLHMPSNRANLFYMIIGYLSTFPYTKQFSHFGMKNIFLAINTQTIKIVVQYSHSVVGSKFQREDYKAFAIHTDPAAPKKQFYANDRKMVRKLVKKVHASFEKDKFMVAFEKVQHIAIKRPKTGAVYSILTDEGAQSFVAHRASPLVVEAESLPIINIIQPMSDTYLMLKVPPSSLEFKQLIGQIENVFHEVVSANRLQSTPENFLRFIQGALEFNYKINEDLRIRPYLDLFDNSYRKLFLQKNAGQGWVSSEPPMIIIASRFEDDVDYDQDESLPSDFDAQQVTYKENIQFLFENGYIKRKCFETPIATRRSLVDQLLNVLDSGNQAVRVRKDIGPVIRRMDLDSEFFFAGRNRMGENFFPKYILGQLMAYSGTIPVETFAFYHKRPNEDSVSFIIRRTGSTDGVAIHVLDDISSGRGPTMPDYKAVGLIGKVLNVYLDCRSMNSMQGYTMSELSRLPLKSINANYTYTTSSSFHAQGVFRKIDQQLVNEDLYLSSIRRNFLALIDLKSIDAGLGSETSFEFETLMKSFCLAKNKLRTFLPYPKSDPTIVGIRSMANLPVVLMKCGVDVTHNELMNDLRSVYIKDHMMPKRQLVIMKVISVNHNNVHTFRGIQEEYTNGVGELYYDMCMNRSSLAQSNDFCRNTRHQENRTEGKSAQYEMTKEIMLQGEIFQKITIYREMIQRHMREVESFSDEWMHDKKAKNIVGAMIDGNYKEVAINLGFLTGSVGPGYAANYTALKGANLAGEGSKFLGSCLRLASPFLARVSSTFVAYDLYKQIQTHNNGNRDALVGVVSDSVVLTIDVGSVVVGTLQVLDLLGSSLSAFLSPIGSAIGAVIFISADVNQAVKTVDRINSLIKLTAYEKFEEGLLASVHANPDKYILDLIEATQPNDEVTKSSMAVVKNMSQFQIYGSPSLERCKPQQSLNICTSGVKEVEDNFANFTQWSKFYSMTWSDTSNNVRIVCANERSIGNSGNFRLGHDGELWLSKGKFFIGKHRMALECNNFEVIFDKNVSNASKAFLKAASGNDSIVGFLERSNVISFSGGNKYFIGGNKPDTFILHDEEIATGFIDGSDGIDTLDFSQYAKSKLSIKFYNGVKTAHFLVMPGSNKRLDIDRVERFIGRADAQDIMITNCNTTFLDLLGGTEQLPDSINIIASNNRLCRYNLAVELYHSTNVWNQACSGTFVYALNKYSKPGIVKLQNSCTSNQSAEIILETNLPLRSVLKMQRIVDDDGHIRVEIQFENGIKLFIIDFNFERTHFLFEDFHVKVKMTEILNLRNVSLIEDPSCMIKGNSELCHLNAALIVEDRNNRTEIKINIPPAREELEKSLLPFIHANLDKNILDLFKAKQLNNEVVKRSTAILRNMSQFQIYGSPSLVRCTPQQSLNMCMNGVKEVEDNFADFTQWSKFYSRTWPNTSNNVTVVCARPIKNPRNLKSVHSGELWRSQNEFFIGNNQMTVECTNFEAIFDSNMPDGKKAFLKAASGNDRIVGFLERSNVISFTNGNKYFIGGNRPDTFILHGEEIAMGFIDGGDGLDTLDFSQYVKSELSVKFYNGYKTAHFLAVPGSNYRLDINSVEGFIGRSDIQDTMITNCNTTFLDLRGGTMQLPDFINISEPPNGSCDYNLVIELHHSTNVWNGACSGTFFYALNKNSRPGTIKIQNFCTNGPNAESIIKTNLPLRAASKMQRIVDDDDDQTQLEIQFENGIVLLVVDFNLDRTHFLFEDFNIRIENTGIVGFMKVPVIENPYDTMQDLLELHHLNAVLIVEDEVNQTKIITAHSRLIANAKNPQHDMLNANVLSNDLKFVDSVLVSARNTENIFNIMTKCWTNFYEHVSSCSPIITTIFLEKNKTSDYRDVIDFSGVYHAMRTEGCTLKITVKVYKSNLFMEIWMIDQKFKKNLVGNVTVHNIDQERLHKHLTVFLDVPFFFQIEPNNVTLKPIPLSFTEEIKLIILQPTDIIEFTSIKISKLASDFLSVLKSNDSHLILTNIMDPDIKNNPDDLLTICLVNYYKSEENVRVFDTLSLEFKDRAILNVGVLLIEKKNDIVEFEDFKDIVRRMNKI